jgi:hypothetical protein
MMQHQQVIDKREQVKEVLNRKCNNLESYMDSFQELSDLPDFKCDEFVGAIVN